MRSWQEDFTADSDLYNEEATDENSLLLKGRELRIVWNGSKNTLPIYVKNPARLVDAQL
jgi:hypothetical protein